MRRLSCHISRSGARSLVVFSQQSPLLQANQVSRGSDCPIWIEDWETDRFKLARIDGQVPVQINIDKPIELFNLSQFENAPDLMTNPKHTSFSTKKPYGEKMQFTLTDFAATQALTSNWWVGKAQAKKEGLILKQKAKPCTVLIRGASKLFHASQLEDGVATLRHWPISGGSRKMYLPDGDTYRILVEAANVNNYSSGLWFSKRQLEGLKLPVPSATPTYLPLSSSPSYGVYNIEQLEEPEVAKAVLGGREELGVPTFLISGDAIRAADKLPKDVYQSCYWISANEATMYNFKIKESELTKGINIFSKTDKTQIEMFNVDQLADPHLGYTRAGLLTG